MFHQKYGIYIILLLLTIFFIWVIGNHFFGKVKEGQAYCPTFDLNGLPHVETKGNNCIYRRGNTTSTQPKSQSIPKAKAPSKPIAPIKKRVLTPEELANLVWPFDDYKYDTEDGPKERPVVLHNTQPKPAALWGAEKNPAQYDFDAIDSNSGTPQRVEGVGTLPDFFNSGSFTNTKIVSRNGFILDEVRCAPWCPPTIIGSSSGGGDSGVELKFQFYNVSQGFCKYARPDGQTSTNGADTRYPDLNQTWTMPENCTFSLNKTPPPTSAPPETTAPSTTSHETSAPPSPETTAPSTTSPETSAPPSSETSALPSIAPETSAPPSLETSAPAETPEGSPVPISSDSSDATGFGEETPVPESTDSSTGSGSTSESGSTLAPGSTSASGSTLEPGSTAASGSTLEPGSTSASGSTLEPESSPSTTSLGSSKIDKDEEKKKKEEEDLSEVENKPGGPAAIKESKDSDPPLYSNKIEEDIDVLNEDVDAALGAINEDDANTLNSVSTRNLLNAVLEDADDVHDDVEAIDLGLERSLRRYGVNVKNTPAYRTVAADYKELERLNKELDDERIALRRAMESNNPAEVKRQLQKISDTVNSINLLKNKTKKDLALLNLKKYTISKANVIRVII